MTHFSLIPSINPNRKVIPLILIKAHRHPTKPFKIAKGNIAKIAPRFPIKGTRPNSALNFSSGD